jgi:hypothetical protein
MRSTDDLGSPITLAQLVTHAEWALSELRATIVVSLRVRRESECLREATWTDATSTNGSGPKDRL